MKNFLSAAAAALLLVLCVTADAFLLGGIGSNPTIGGITSILPTEAPGLTAWYKVDAVVGKNDGDSLSSLNDSSGNGRHLSAAGATPPLYKANQIGGKPTLRTDGASTTWLATAVDSTELIPDSPYTVFAVLKANAVVNNDTGDYWGNDTVWMPNGHVAAGLWLRANGGNPLVLTGGFDTDRRKVETSITIGTPFVVCARFDGTNLYLQKNGDTELSVAHVVLNDHVGGVMRVGAQGGQGSQVDLAELFFHNASLSALNRMGLLKYLTDKYGISP